MTDKNEQRESLTIEQVEQDIYDIYRFWAVADPEVKPKEVGRLQVLWKVWDTLYKQEKEAEPGA